MLTQQSAERTLPLSFPKAHSGPGGGEETVWDRTHATVWASETQTEPKPKAESNLLFKQS